MMQKTIATQLQQCVLRGWAPADTGPLAAIANNRRIWRNLTDLFPHPYTLVDAQYWIQHANTPSASLHLAIEVGGDLAGGIGIIAGEGIRQYTGQFGYWLGEPFWGRGIATAAARALVKYACEQLSFARLEAEVFAWNSPSMRVLEKTGFVREGILRNSVYKDTQLTDSVMYAYVPDRTSLGKDPHPA